MRVDDAGDGTVGAAARVTRHVRDVRVEGRVKRLRVVHRVVWQGGGVGHGDGRGGERRAAIEDGEGVPRAGPVGVLRGGEVGVGAAEAVGEVDAKRGL